METVTDAPQTDTAVIEKPETPVTESDGAPASVEKPFDPKTIPTEIRSYFEKDFQEREKKYADYDANARAAKDWQAVQRDPRFGEWVKGLNAPATPKSFEITDDQFTAALTDKRQFAQLVQEAAKNLLETTLGPQLQSTQQRVQLQEKVGELQDVCKRFPDFMDLDKKGKIEPIILKYPNLSFEDAYWLAKRANFSAEVDAKARGVVEKKKAAGVERPGNPPGTRTSKVKAKNREEAMSLAMAAARAGQPMPDFEDIGDG